MQQDWLLLRPGLPSLEVRSRLKLFFQGLLSPNEAKTYQTPKSFPAVNKVSGVCSKCFVSTPLRNRAGFFFFPVVGLFFFLGDA